ncbi:MAG TPA: PAS domain-containing protein [Oscillatoriaceae cyanobacterium M33_DOE_052]|uniref:histidine kinase n=1 Tax=Planktothricoides sp. SpSt-374 TaxID=2282167 RepID=A0A7C3VSB1_9CYAN|nr:PAS domain-containing protein [Oscillatoriaceae cyanobacterium M33_DOE_052]
MFIKTHLTPGKIVALYALVGGFWIICSDKLLYLLFANPATITLNRLQTIKGWFYVLATAVLLYWLIQRYAAALYRFQKELQLEDARLRGILETNRDGIVVFDRAGIVTLSNQSARDIFGLEVGNDYRDCLKHIQVVNSTCFSETEHPFIQVMQTGQPLAGMECILSHPDGDVILSVNAAPLYDAHGKIDGVVTSITDITSHKLAEVAERDRDVAQAKIRAKTEFLAHITHELRTPLNGILGMSQMLQRQIFGALNPKQQDYLRRIYGSGEHLLELIDDILDLSKVEAGKEQLKLAPISVTDVCQSCLKLVQERAFEKGLHIHSDIEAAAKICIADKRRLKQMLINLLANAIKFTPSGSISLIVRQLPDGMYFTVAEPVSASLLKICTCYFNLSSS